MDDFLAQRIHQGRVALFLGSGASLGCTNRLGKAPPLGGQLVSILANAMSTAVDASEDLQTVSAVARRRLGTQFDELLRDNYTITRPSDDYKRLSNYAFHHIFTTNIDDGLELSFNAASANFRTFHYRQPPFEIRNSTSEINIIKLNGSVDRLYDGIIFSDQEYSVSLNTLTWYEELINEYLSGTTFVFIGTALREPIFWFHLSRLMMATDRAPGTGYVICPHFPEISAENLRAKNLIPVPGTLTDFVEFLGRQVGVSVTTRDIEKERMPGFIQVLQNLGFRSSPDIVRGLYNVITVSRDELTRSVPPPRTPRLRDFYIGNAPTWRDIMDGVHANLHLFEAVKAALRGTSRLMVVHGTAGCGKSTCILDCALWRADQSGRKVYYVRSNRDFPTDAIRFIGQQLEEELLFVVDNFEQYSESVHELLEDESLNHLRFLTAERTTAWSRIKSNFDRLRPTTFTMRWITRDDAAKILHKLEQYGDWSRMAHLSEQQRIVEIYEHPRRQLLVALKEVTTGRGFDQIIRSEYEGIGDQYERVAYQVVALATMHRLQISIGTFDSTMRRQFSRTKLPRDMNLEGIILEEAEGLSLRHRVIADHIIRRVVNRDNVAKVIGLVMAAQSRLGSPLRRTSRSIEYRLFGVITNHQFMLDMFRHHPESILETFENNEGYYENDFFFWLQRALFEFEARRDLRPSALDHIRIAMNLAPTSFQVVHAYSNMHLQMAEDAASQEEALLLMQEASDALEDQIRDVVNERYALRVLAIGRVKVYKKWFPTEVRKEAAQMVERLREVRRRYPNDPETETAIRQVSLIPVQTVDSPSGTRQRRPAVGGGGNRQRGHRPRGTPS